MDGQKQISRHRDAARTLGAGDSNGEIQFSMPIETFKKKKKMEAPSN